MSEKKKRKTRAATTRKKIVKVESTPTPQRKSSAARTRCRQDTASESATPVKDRDEENRMHALLFLLHFFARVFICTYVLSNSSRAVRDIFDTVDKNLRKFTFRL